jgi:hypothetical protein
MKNLFTIEPDYSVTIQGANCKHFYTKKLKALLSDKLHLNLYVNVESAKYYESDIVLYDLLEEKIIEVPNDIETEIEKTIINVRNFVDVNFSI